MKRCKDRLREFKVEMRTLNRAHVREWQLVRFGECCVCGGTGQ